jgi:hypothetical protein
MFFKSDEYEQTTQLIPPVEWTFRVALHEGQKGQGMMLGRNAFFQLARAPVLHS